MSRTQHEADLCALLVEDVYGELSSRIFTLLLRRGRLTIPALVQQLGLRPSLVKQGLVVLIQQNLIYYYYQPSTNVTFYEANWDAAYALARTGRIADIVEARFGKDARDVVKNLLSLGHTRIGDLVEAYRVEKPKTNGHVNGATNGLGEDAEMANGDHQQGGLTHAEIDSILYKLLQCGYLQPVSASMFKSPADVYNDIEQELLKRMDGPAKGPKKQEELKGNVRRQMQDLRDKAGKWQPLTKGNKRSRDASESIGPDKRRKLTNGASVNGNSHELDGEDIRLDVNLVVRVNHEKLAVALRNQHLVELAENYIGVTTAFVYSKLLALMEDRIPRCRPDPIIDDDPDPDQPKETPIISTIDIMASLPKSLDMSKGIGKPSKDAVGGAKVKADSGGDVDMTRDVDENGNIPEVDDESDSGEDEFRPLTPARSNKVNQRPDVAVDKRVRLEQVKQHLLLLSGDNRGFVKQVGGAGRYSWTVDFEALGEFLKEHELDTIIFAKFQEKGIRLSRILREKGRLEEKQISNLALMKPNDVRTLLVEMQMAGFVDIQEVPKDAQRVATKAFFLWYFDAERVTKLVTDGIYKAMSRALQRLDVERFRDKVALGVLERSDVNGNVELLDKDTKADVNQYLRKEELLLGLMTKLDKTAAVFRDY